MPVRSAQATWEGTLKEGAGKIRLETGAFEGQYSFNSRFESGTGTNPEELIAAAEAGCYSMALSASLESAGFPATTVQTTAEVHINKQNSGWKINLIDLRNESEVPGITEEEFQKIAAETKENCPVSQALSGAEITLDAKLAG